MYRRLRRIKVRGTPNQRKAGFRGPDRTAPLDGGWCDFDTWIMRTPFLPGLAVLLAAGCLLPLLATPEAIAGPEGGTAVLRTLELSRVEGALTALDATSVTLTDKAGTARTFPLTETIGITFPAEVVRRAKGLHVRAHLTDGSTLHGRLAGGDEDILRLETEALGTVEVLLDYLRTIEALPREVSPCHDTASLHPRAEDGDIAYDTDEDEFRGTALEVNNEGVVLETAGKRERTVAWTSLRVLHLENDVAPKPKGLWAEIELHDGSRLRTTTAPALESGSFLFRLQAMGKKERRVALAQTRAVRWYGGRFVYASNLPFEAKREGEFRELADPDGDKSIWFATRTDRRVSGCPLRIGGETFRHGFGVQSKSTITINLDGKFASFRSAFGIDDEVLAEAGTSKHRGNVDARILGDGKELWKAKDVVGGQKARSVGPLDVTGVKVLVLEVGFGKAEFGRMGTFDRADWGDPILVKSTK